VRVRYSLPALADLNSVLDSIAANSPQGARRVQRRIQAIVGQLPHYPRMGIRTDDPTIRRLTATPYPYLVFYEIVGEEIVIHAVRHAARNPHGMPGSE
jgi:plasmid stabilization system protein ParE